MCVCLSSRLRLTGRAANRARHTLEEHTRPKKEHKKMQQKGSSVVDDAAGARHGIVDVIPSQGEGRRLGDESVVSARAHL